MENSLEQAHEQFKKVTPRQIAIIKELAEGKDASEVAAVLGISFRTVNTHRHEIMKRTGCKNMVHVVATFIRTGVIA